MTATILVMNAGSSSIKFQLFSVTGDGGLCCELKGSLEGIGANPRLVARAHDGKRVADEIWPVAEVKALPDAMDKVVAFLRAQLGGALPDAIGHRVVHGGPKYRKPIVVTDGVLEDLGRLVPLAPLHQPNNLAPIHAVRKHHPAMIQVACFDTAFHRHHPELADRYAIPEKFHAEGVRRYGFHGLSYEYVVDRLRVVAPHLLEGRVIVAHLGSGASMCALLAGRSVESTMGFTALDGLPMATRPGQLDAGVLLYLMKEHQMTVQDIERLLYYECGLKGLSGFSKDIRDLLASTDERARFAIEYFVYRIALYAGMLAAAMGGMDAFVFTAGIGENAPPVRFAIGRRLAWLGLKLDPCANHTGRMQISHIRSRVACYVIPTDEELMIARHTLRVLRTA